MKADDARYITNQINERLSVTVIADPDWCIVTSNGDAFGLVQVGNRTSVHLGDEIFSAKVSAPFLAAVMIVSLLVVVGLIAAGLSRMRGKAD